MRQGVRSRCWGTLKKKRRTEITIETNELFMIGKRPVVYLLWCAECGRPSGMVTVDEAATIAGVPSRAIYRRVEVGEVHFVETPEGGLQICLNSLDRSEFSTG
jgi:hypothetical protein